MRQVGCIRGVNPALGAAGDGVEVADLTFVATLCRQWPHVKFLITVRRPLPFLTFR